jgi:pimeloyl-ACP methyl ester carboxylesterase
LSASALPLVEAPTLLVVGGEDGAALDANRDAMRRMRAYVELEIVPRAPHFFEEPGTLAQVERVAARWFARYLRRPSAGAHTRSLPKL